MFGNGTASIGRTEPNRPVKEDHLWRWTTSTGKFPGRPKRSIDFSTEISDNLGIMESSLCLDTNYTCREGDRFFSVLDEILREK